MPPTNQTGMDAFDGSLIMRTTQLVIEENIQDRLQIRLVDNPSLAHIFVYPTFLDYDRPDVKMSLGIFSLKTETVFLRMSITFYEPEYDFYQKVECRTSLVKDVRSNFYTILDSELDFADSLLFNLVKKGIGECFTDYNKIIF
jgi:hypothetical protein